MAETQDYSNHTRWNPFVHFVIAPILFFNIIWQSVRLYQDFSWDRAEAVLIAVTLMMLSVAARLQALKAQDRVIRLEERLRFAKLLPADLAEKASDLPVSKMIALRFASDAELPELAAKVVNGELATSKDIKLAVKNWRGDFLRV